MSVEEKLNESYEHIERYLDDPSEVPLLKAMCSKCEMYTGSKHDYSECRNQPCFKCFLGYEYMCWSDSYE